MKLVKLTWASIFRDGGSYGAEFSTDEDLNYSIFLECSRMPDGRRLHHRWLFGYQGSFSERSKNGVPIITGSIEEQELINRLKLFLEANPKPNKEKRYDSDNHRMLMLEELLYYIPLREPCFASDIKANFSK